MKRSWLYFDGKRINSQNSHNGIKDKQKQDNTEKGLISSIQHGWDMMTNQHGEDVLNQAGLDETDCFSTSSQNNNAVVWDTGLLVSFNSNLLNLNQ